MDPRVTTPNLELPEVPVAIATASDELNEGFLRLDAIVQLAVISKELLAPPSVALQGARYIVAVPGSGEWLNWGKSVAFRGPDGWHRYIPRPGWTARVLDEAAFYVYDGTAWVLEEDETGGGGGDGDENPFDAPPPIPDPQDDEFDDEVFDTAKWTWFNQGGATVAEDSSTHEHMILSGPGGTENYRLLYQPTSGPTWKYRCKMFGVMASTNFAHAGLLLRESTSGRMIAIGPIFASAQGIYAQKMNSATSYAGTAYTAASSHQKYFYLEVEFDGTSLFFRYLGGDAAEQWNPFPSGVPAFTLMLTEGPASFLTAVPDQVGIFVDSNNGQPVEAYVDWFRKIA